MKSPKKAVIQLAKMAGKPVADFIKLKPTEKARAAITYGMRIGKAGNEAGIWSTEIPTDPEYWNRIENDDAGMDDMLGFEEDDEDIIPPLVARIPSVEYVDPATGAIVKARLGGPRMDSPAGDFVSTYGVEIEDALAMLNSGRYDLLRSISDQLQSDTRLSDAGLDTLVANIKAVSNGQRMPMRILSKAEQEQGRAQALEAEQARNELRAQEEQQALRELTDPNALRNNTKKTDAATLKKVDYALVRQNFKLKYGKTPDEIADLNTAGDVDSIEWFAMLARTDPTLMVTEAIDIIINEYR